MPSKTTLTRRYAALTKALIAARKAAGQTQEELAFRLGKPQSYVAKVERAERRLDVVEFLSIVDELGADGCAILKAVRAVGERS